jgi:hypothetical protein
MLQAEMGSTEAEATADVVEIAQAAEAAQEEGHGLEPDPREHREAVREMGQPAWSALPRLTYQRCRRPHETAVKVGLGLLFSACGSITLTSVRG